MTRNDEAKAAARAHTLDGPLPLVDLFLKSLEALAAAGEADTACRLAGHACALYRTTDEATWSRFNRLLHRLARYV